MLLTLNNKYRQRGIGLLELMLSISIIALLLIMATRYYAGTKRSKEITEAVSLVQAIRAGAANFATPGGYRAGLSMEILINAGLLPKEITDYKKASPWQTEVTATTAPTTGLTITMITVPPGSPAEADVCPLLLPQFQADADPTSGCSGGKLTLVYKY